VPAGGLSQDLSPKEVAQQELFEEIGGTAADLHHVGQFYTSNGISSEVVQNTLPPALSWGKPTAS
jgi:8-oxo-dGTP pyrophosphatase MutT (NUDIX family)